MANQDNVIQTLNAALAEAQQSNDYAKTRQCIAERQAELDPANDRIADNERGQPGEREKFANIDGRKGAVQAVINACNEELDAKEEWFAAYERRLVAAEKTASERRQASGDRLRELDEEMKDGGEKLAALEERLVAAKKKRKEAGRKCGYEGGSDAEMNVEKQNGETWSSLRDPTRTEF